MSITLFVPGLPIPQGRPRFTTYRVGEFNRVKVFDPTRSAEWKQTVKKYATLAMQQDKFVGRNWMLELGIAIHLRLAFILPRPQRLPKRVTHHVKKPDLDNLVKAVKDALTGILYARDSQVVRLSAEKRYGKTPGVRITVKETP